MLFWVIAAGLTIFCVVLTLYPLVRRSAGASRAGKFDLEVYKVSDPDDFLIWFGFTGRSSTPRAMA